MKIAIIYHQFPHYRAPVLRELVLRGENEYKFYASAEDFDGVKAFRGDSIVAISPLKVLRTNRGFKFVKYLGLARDESIDAFVIIGNPNIIATWVIGILARLRGKKVLYWAHGWLSPESNPKKLIRKVYYSISNMLLVYGERSKLIGESGGYPPDRIRVIYNSLDYCASSRVLLGIESSKCNRMSDQLFGDCSRPLLICTARLTELCRFDLLISAAYLLGQRGIPVNVLLVGEGPARHDLEAQAQRLLVDVHFYGACYDEAVIGRLIYEADATVSPGKIGLTAIHSLTYGTPAFTHADLDHQMPEVEAITPGLTGDFFTRDSPEDLARCLEAWFERKVDRGEIRRNCRSMISARWNPAVQRELIENALDAVFQNGRSQ